MLGGMHGLRERKKQRTRQAIRDAALHLFAQRGFDNVTVAEVAQAADVAEKTVFNYFGTKEALFFDQDAPIEADLVTAIRQRTPGESAVAAVRRYLAGHLEAPAAIPEHYHGLPVLAHSPALQAYLRELFARSEQTVAQVLAEETATDPDGIEPRVAATALVGALRTLYERFLAAAASGQDAKDAMAALPRDVQRAFDLLERGLGAYATADPSPTPSDAKTLHPRRRRSRPADASQRATAPPPASPRHTPPDSTTRPSAD
jgi:AcrR family transcriptional regulator